MITTRVVWQTVSGKTADQKHQQRSANGVEVGHLFQANAFFTQAKLETERETDPKMSFGSGGVKASDHVADVWSQPGADTDMNRLKLGLAETIYRSSKREPLGKGYQRGHQLPQKVRANTFMFGVSSDKSEAAKALLYPHPSDADMQESSSRYGPGEQRRRGYRWDVDIENHRFGRPGNLASPLCLDSGLEPPRRLVSKKLDDFRETQDTIGRVKNLGHDSREHLGKHIYGKETVKRGPDEWDARACVEGDYGWAEQQPDADLGKSITPVFATPLPKDERLGSQAFDLISSHTHSPRWLTLKIMEMILREVHIGLVLELLKPTTFIPLPLAIICGGLRACLVNPSQFSSVGIEDEEFFKSRGKAEIRLLFESIGYPFSDPVFEALWSTVAQKCPDLEEEASSIVRFQRVVNDHKHAQDIQASVGAA